MTDIDYLKLKLIADFSGYIGGFLAGYLSNKYFFKKNNVITPLKNLEEKVFYYLGIFGGAMFFAILVSTFDNYISGYFLHNFGGNFVLSKTIAGAIAGGVIASEIFKKIYNYNFNTGISFVPSLIIGIIIGRIGAFLIGLRDNTHGISTNLAWGYDYGDGILRHPAQIYEILILLIFGLILILGLRYKRFWWLKNGFFMFTLVYFSYRFLSGFIMPYSHFWLGINTIQLVSIFVIIYSIYKLIKYK